MNEIWSRKKLTKMLYHNFVGTIADNIIEIGWILCFSLLADKRMVERITTMFGLNDSFWVVLSSTYYTTRTALASRLPKLIQEKGEEEESKQLKNHVYLFYIMLLPSVIGIWLILPKILLILGVSSGDLSLYVPYFRLSFISILIAAPWSIMVPAYLRIKGDSRTATLLDHLVAWSMLVGVFITTHLFHHGVLWALIVNIFANLIPLFWFIINRPIPNFWSKGFEFSWGDIKKSWAIVKWELVRRLSPRISAIVGAGIMVTINPLYFAAKYWVANLATFLEGWVDASAGLLNTNVSRNVGIKNTSNPLLVPYEDNEYIFRKTIVGLIITDIFVYLVMYYGLSFLPNSIYKLLIDPVIYILLFVEVITKTRYYMWLSISRSYRLDLNGVAQLIYAIPTAILTPFLLYLFLIQLDTGFLGIPMTGALIGSVQCVLTEIYFRAKLRNEQA